MEKMKENAERLLHIVLKGGIHVVEDGACVKILAAVDTLPKKEAEIIRARYGLNKEGVRYSLRQVAETYGCSIEGIHKIEKRAKRRLRARLPDASKASEELISEAAKLIESYSLIIGNINSPTARRLKEISEKLKRNSGDDKVREIDEYNFSTRTYKCLMSHDIDTIDKILSYPKGKWRKIKNLGTVSYREIERIVHELGFKNFYILT